MQSPKPVDFYKKYAVRINFFSDGILFAEYQLQNILCKFLDHIWIFKSFIVPVFYYSS